MFFKDYLRATADVIAAKFRSGCWHGQNPADIGEIAETIVEEFLGRFLSSQFAVFRGGQIVNIEGTKSAQMDVVLCSKNCPNIFSDKGLYPVETVLGAFAITSNLTRAKLDDSVDCLASIPTDNPMFYLFGYGPPKLDLDSATIEAWKKRVPY